MEVKKKKLLVFHQALAPYRVDLWNKLSELFDLKVYYMYENLLDQKFNQDKLKEKLLFKPEYLKSGITIGVRAFRWGFKSIIDEFKPDIVITYEFSQTTISVYLLKRTFGYKFKLYSISDDSLKIVETCSGLRKKLRTHLVGKLDGLILVNNDVANWYGLNFGTQKKWMVLPIIAKEDLFRKALEEALPVANVFLGNYNLKRKKIVFFIGRLMPVKGIDRLIKAFSSTSKNQKDALLIIIGDGDERDNLKKLTVECGIADKVLFPGRYEGNELMGWFNIGQIFVLASHHEPFGAVVNEALLAGANVLCSSYAGASTLISPSINGDLFDPYDIQTLSDMLNKELKSISPLDSLNIIRPSRMNVSFDKVIETVYTQLDV